MKKRLLLLSILSVLFLGACEKMDSGGNIVAPAPAPNLSYFHLSGSQVMNWPGNTVVSLTRTDNYRDPQSTPSYLLEAADSTDLLDITFNLQINLSLGWASAMNFTAQLANDTGIAAISITSFTVKLSQPYGLPSSIMTGTFEGHPTNLPDSNIIKGSFKLFID